MIKPKVEIDYLEMEDPTFNCSETKVARARLTNTTAKQWTYQVELYFGVTKVPTSGIGNITIPANSYVDVDFTIVMPAIEGTFQPFLDVSESGVLLKHYQATSTVTTQILPDIDVGPITWI